MILYNPTVSGSLLVTGSLTTTGTITSQTLVVQTITSSIEFNTGSTRNGTLLTNTHEFTGSVLMTGSLSVTTTGTELQVNAGGVNIGNALTDNHVISGSLRVNTNALFVSSSGNVGVGANPNQSGIGSSNRVLTVKAASSGGEALLELIGLGNNATDNIAKISFMNQAATTALASIEAIRGSSDTVGELSIKTSNTTRLSISSLGAIGIAVTPITDPYTATGGGWKTVQFGKGGILGAYGTDNESMTGFNTYVTTDGSNKAIISSIGGTAIRYYEDRITFNTLSTSGTAQTQTERMRISNNGDLSLTSGVAILNRSGKKIELNPNSALTNTTAEIEITSGMDLFFKLGGSERMRITSGGDLILGIAAAATNVNFDINGIVNKAGRIRFQESGNSKWLIGNGAASENGRFEIYDNVNGTGVQLLKGATSWTAASDERFKDIIEPIENVIIKFKNIRTVIGKYKTDNEAVRRNFLIAQDLLKVFPEVVDVDENEEKPMGIRYQDLIPVLVTAIQELSAKNTALEEILQRNNIQ